MGEMNLDELGRKPCPFCGGAFLARYGWGDDMWYIKCFDCGAAGPETPAKEEAIAAWNRRATDGQRAGVPKGWKLVPVEPEPKQLEAIKAAYRSARRGGIGGQSMDGTFRREWAPELQAYAAAIAAAPTPPAGDAVRLEGVNKVERESDFSVRLTFDSCRQASAFDRAAMAPMAATKGGKE